MVNSIQDQAKAEDRERRLTRAEANEILAEYREALEGYTYLDFTRRGGPPRTGAAGGLVSGKLSRWPSFLRLGAEVALVQGVGRISSGDPLDDVEAVALEGPGT